VRIRTIILSGLTSAASFIILLLIFQFSLSSAEASQLKISNAGWIDQFDNPTLNSRWEWVREDPTHWSLTDNSGYLRINTQNGSTYISGTGKNILLTPPDMEDFQITTKVTFSPIENFQSASAVVYQDDDNYIELARRYGDLDKIDFRFEEGGIFSGRFITETATTVYLRITKFGDVYASSYSIDGNNWIEVYQFNASFSSPKVGLTAYNGSSTLEIPADFDYFQLSKPGKLLYVAPAGECGEADPCYATIQEAVDTAESFDTIKVAAGTYSDLHVFPRDDFATTGVVTQVVYLTKSLTLQGGYSPLDWETSDPQANPTLLDAQGKGRVIYITGDINPRIQGFTITGGDASGLGGEGMGGGDAGGGIYFWESPVTLIYNQIISNTAESGGGIYGKGTGGGQPGENCWIIENSIISNTAQYGGGMSLSCNSWVYGNDIHHNQNGGIEFFLGYHQLHNNLIHNNTASRGGSGLGFQLSQATLVNNLIADNVNLEKGAAIENFVASLNLIHNTIARNTSGDGDDIGINNKSDLEYFEETPTLTLTNTIIVSQAIGIDADDLGSVMIDSILWHNVPITVSQSPTAVVSVKNEYSGDPLFAADGYHLTAGSAALDKGLDAGVTVDIDGEPRPAGAGFDLGADELWPKVYLPMIPYQ